MIYFGKPNVHSLNTQNIRGSILRVLMGVYIHLISIQRTGRKLCIHVPWLLSTNEKNALDQQHQIWYDLL